MLFCFFYAKIFFCSFSLFLLIGFEYFMCVLENYVNIAEFTSGIGSIFASRKRETVFEKTGGKETGGKELRRNDNKNK